MRCVDSRIDTLEKQEGLNAVRNEVASLEKRTEEGLAARRGEIVSLEKRMEAGFNAVRTEIGYTNRRLDEALEIRERLAALEAKVAAR